MQSNLILVHTALVHIAHNKVYGKITMNVSARALVELSIEIFIGTVEIFVGLSLETSVRMSVETGVETWLGRFVEIPVEIFADSPVEIFVKVSVDTVLKNTVLVPAFC